MVEIVLSPEVKLYQSFFPRNSLIHDNDTSLIWLGANTILLRNEKTSLLIDPYFSRLSINDTLKGIFSPIQPREDRIRHGLDLFGLDKVDIILVTHSHQDHAMDIFKVSEFVNANRVYIPPLLYYTTKEKVNETMYIMLQDEVSIEMKNTKIEVVKGKHMPFPFPIAKLERIYDNLRKKNYLLKYVWQYTAPEIFNFFIIINRTKIFIMGSAGIPQKSLQGRKTDILVLSVGGLNFLSRKYCDRLLEEIVDVLEPQKIWFSHWDDFSLPLDKPIKWLKGAQTAVDYLIAQSRKRNIQSYLLPPHISLSLNLD